MHIYFVSYSHSTGKGNCECHMEKPITCIDDVRIIECDLNKSDGCNGVCVDSWIEFKEMANNI